MNTLEAFAKLNDDKALAEKIQAAAKTPEDVYEALKGIGLTDDLDTFLAEAAKYSEAYSQLSAEEIESLSGGGTTITTLTTFTTYPISAALAGI
ncbi:MAG: hypothetical protein Q4B73_05945 [Lachnospiraceae bacterium]|nr:hypothetical protein [Lachnospiraceae bacterium]